MVANLGIHWQTALSNKKMSQQMQSSLSKHEICKRVRFMFEVVIRTTDIVSSVLHFSNQKTCKKLVNTVVLKVLVVKRISTT